MDGRAWRAAVWVGLTAVTVACGGAKQEPQNARRSTVEAEFKRCIDQEKYGEAKGCWHAFLDRFGDAGSTAELAYAKEHVEKGSPAAQSPAEGGDDAVARGAKGSEGLVRLQEKENTQPGAAVGFPPQRVAYDECYKGFRVTGVPARDVAELGERCGAPCGMIPFSGIVEDSQDESDNVDVYGVSLRDDLCYRFFAVGESAISDLDSAIADSEGNVILRDVFQDAAPILGPEKPFCPTSAGRYKFVVSVAKGSGRFSFQVWQGPKR